MLIGGMAASKHYDTRRILSYHVISQIGYMIMGLGIFTPLAIAGSIYFTIHNMIAKTNTLLVAGLIRKLKGHYDIRNVGGLYKENPLLAMLFIIPAFALAGIPPLSGFFAKFVLIKAGLEDQHYIITAVAIITSMLTLYSMIKIWNEAFLKKSIDEPIKHVKLKVIEIIPSVILGIGSVLLGVFARYIFEFTMKAAEQLLHYQFYIDKILNPVMQ
jgi:multicomponent Na+:H+ antiporter subunit D